MQRTALCAAGDAERWVSWGRGTKCGLSLFWESWRPLLRSRDSLCVTPR